VSKKVLLIAGGSHSDIPMIESAKKLGYYVVTSGNNPNDVGHKYADEMCLEDFSNKEAMLQLAKKLNIDAICSSSNDFSIITSSFVSEKLNLQGYDSYETTLLIHHKDKFKKFAIKNDFLVPNSQAFTCLKDALKAISTLKYPSIVKPIDLTGGKGITKISTDTEAKKAIENAFSISRAKKIVIDDFVAGSLHSFSTIIRDEKVVFCFGDSEYSYKNMYLVSTSTTPSPNFEYIKKILIEQTEKLARLLNLVDGILHMQYLMNGEDINIIEFTRRMPGDLYYKPVLYATGINYADFIVKAYCDLDISDVTIPKQSGFYSRHCVMSKKNGVIKNILFDSSIRKNIIDKELWYQRNDIIDNYLTYKAGIIFLKYTSEEEMISKTQDINELIRIELDDTI